MCGVRAKARSGAPAEIQRQGQITGKSRAARLSLVVAVMKRARKRFLALGSLSILGVACAFVMGASAGAALNGQVNSISVARIPVYALQSASRHK